MNHKRTANRFLLLVVLLLPAIILESAYIFPKAAPSFTGHSMQLVGWPFARDAGAAYYDQKGIWIPFDQTHINGIHYGYAFAIWINIGISIVAIFVIFLALTYEIIPNFPRLRLIDCFLLIFAGALVALYFKSNPHLIIVWNESVMHRPEMLRQTIRPLWQNVIAAIYIFLASYSVGILTLRLFSPAKFEHAG